MAGTPSEMPSQILSILVRDSAHFSSRDSATGTWVEEAVAILLQNCSSAFVSPAVVNVYAFLSLSLSFSRRRLRNERASRARKNHPTVLASIIPRFLAQRGGKQRTREHWRTASTAVLRNCFLSSFSAGEIFGFEEKSRNFPLSWKQERISSGGGSDSRGMNGSPKTFGEMPEGAARLCQILGKVSAEFSGL